MVVGGKRRLRLSLRLEMDVLAANNQPMNAFDHELDSIFGANTLCLLWIDREKQEMKAREKWTTSLDFSTLGSGQSEKLAETAVRLEGKEK